MRSISIEWWAPSRLQVYQLVIRKNDHAVKRMTGSIRTYGFKIPLLVTGAGEIIDGRQFDLFFVRFPLFGPRRNTHLGVLIVAIVGSDIVVNQTLEILTLKEGRYELLCNAAQKGKLHSLVLPGLEFDLAEIL